MDGMTQFLSNFTEGGEMVEQYEARAYIKLKEEEEGKEEEVQKAKIKKFLSIMGQLLFQKALTDIYEEGMEAGSPSSTFMLKLTDFFISCTLSFYSSKKPEEEIIKEINSFLDAVKQDALQGLKHTAELIEEFKF
jgi:hypothetical protein